MPPPRRRQLYPARVIFTPARGPDLDVVAARHSDSGDFASHLVRHLAESGAGGVHFAPVTHVSRDEVRHESERRWSTQLTEPGWGRVFLLVKRDRPNGWDRVVGHAELRGGLLHSNLHRVDFSIGIEEPYRAGGQGARLAEAALTFAYRSVQIAYVDLRVFAKNERAKRLYERLGFVEVGRIDDAFRMADGTSIDDILMVRRLR